MEMEEGDPDGGCDGPALEIPGYKLENVGYREDSEAVGLLGPTRFQHSVEGSVAL